MDLLPHWFGDQLSEEGVLAVAGRLKVLLVVEIVGEGGFCLKFWKLKINIVYLGLWLENSASQICET